MSLYGMMRTGGSGMNAQANRLSTVAENIANASTTGYKRSSTEFSSLILPTTGGSYNSGGVETKIRRSIDDEGATTSTTSGSDLRIKGEGFFVVSDAAGKSFMTRAGAFTKDDKGNLVNAAGYNLQGYAYENGKAPTAVANGFGGLTNINLQAGGLVATGTTKVAFGANLDMRTVDNAPAAQTSIQVFDTQGNTRLLDIAYTKTATNTWRADVTDRASGTQIGTAAMTFDDKGTLTSTPLTLTTTSLPVAGATLESIEIDMSNTTQLGAAFTPVPGTKNGNAPSAVAGFEIDDEGIVYVRYANNDLDPRYRLALASVQSINNLEPQAGNVYLAGSASGEVSLGYAGTGQFGGIQTNALESSNVDIADELTSMIESQRSYTANSKVFQTGADLLDVLVNLKR
ncbi:flagellar hook protein FlgE [Rhizobium sp. Leaf341]|uniref:flagellar hook protein FlgE n=1 Tax=Rhizobium sp. Leaf341 TaxID=1736344 RepID=UPI000712AAD7|nr:flagellar hook protein FlgE [Rhizobium sp. Leaf341]KQR77734.1 flagellar biosynthesis protein FlgE [Rhizobium sp. Leaf341]